MGTGKSILREKSFDFALEVIREYKFLLDKKEFVMSKQLLRSATAVGALVREAQNGEGRKDFIHKLGIAQKECDESLYWVELLHAADYFETDQAQRLTDRAEQVLKMIKSSILTAKAKLPKKSTHR